MQQRTWNQPLREEPEEAAAPGSEMVVPRRRIPDSAEMDITPMIDVTFLLLVFFLVTSMVPDPSRVVHLPPARHGAAVNPRTSVIITVAEREAPGPALVYLGDGKAGTPLPDDPARQEALITRAVREGFAEGRSTVLIKAERGVKHREVSRVATAAAEVEGIQLHLAVLEVQ
jgi:biopolymer transport protein ExbD